MLLGGDLEPLAHRAFLEGVPDAAFHATYAGQLLGLFLAYKVAQVNFSSVLRYDMHLVYSSTPRASYPSLVPQRPTLEMNVWNSNSTSTYNTRYTELRVVPLGHCCCRRSLLDVRRLHAVRAWYVNTGYTLHNTWYIVVYRGHSFVPTVTVKRQQTRLLTFE